ncbi:MAG: ligase-associated DNA damage response endonuclease PdeM [Gammaproteobacteria bacterium]|jgi:DNA ligase-associated metallophosphoesterase
MLQYDCQGERLELFAERAVFWPRRRSLLVADTHFGKDACFRRAGIPIPLGPMHGDLQRLGSLVEACRAERVVVLGDFVHSRPRSDDPLMGALQDWCEERPELEIAVIPGNHDRHTVGQALGSRICWLEEGTLEPPFVFRHEPGEDARGYVLSGHVHPVIRIKGPAGDRLRLPVFQFCSRWAVLPSFGEFTGGAPVQPGPQDNIIAVGPGGLMDLSPREPAHA